MNLGFFENKKGSAVIGSSLKANKIIDLFFKSGKIFFDTIIRENTKGTIDYKVCQDF